jgi:hypothetical protein
MLMGQSRRHIATSTDQFATRRPAHQTIVLQVPGLEKGESRLDFTAIREIDVFYKGCR